MMSADFPYAKITLITVCYQAVSLLPTTFRSIAQLTHPNWDYIVIDGGSADGSAELLDQNAHLITHSVSEPDKGIYDAMNKGWARAHPDSAILFLGAGDTIETLPLLPDPWPADTVYMGNVWMGDRLFRSRSNLKTKIGNTIHHQALLVPRALCPAPPFDLRYPHYADYQFNLRLLQQGVSFVHTEQLQASAAPGGVSSKTHVRELVTLIRRNLGLGWATLATLNYLYQAIRHGHLLERQ